MRSQRLLEVDAIAPIHTKCVFVNVANMRRHHRFVMILLSLILMILFFRFRDRSSLLISSDRFTVTQPSGAWSQSASNFRAALLRIELEKCRIQYTFIKEITPKN